MTLFVFLICVLITVAKRDPVKFIEHLLQRRKEREALYDITLKRHMF